MIYHDRQQAELELEGNRKALPQFTWRIAEWDKDGRRVYEPIKVCKLCGERNPGHRCYLA